MRVEGDAAKTYTAVRLDSFAPVEGSGALMMADDVTGEVRWKDASGEICAKTLGPHSIRIIPKRLAGHGP